jgi:hypothetical protein
MGKYPGCDFAGTFTGSRTLNVRVRIPPFAASLFMTASVSKIIGHISFAEALASRSAIHAIPTGVFLW